MQKINALIPFVSVHMCVNSFTISPSSEITLICGVQVRLDDQKVSCGTPPVSKYLSYLLIKKKNLPVNTIIFSSNSLTFSSFH